MPHRELLRERKIGPTARWSKTKEALSSDTRYKAVPRDAREQLFRQYIAEQEVSARPPPGACAPGRSHPPLLPP
jgi:hypothetical protein